MVEHTVAGLEDTKPADKGAAADTKLADKEAAADTKTALDREYPDMVTALCLVRHTDYIDRRMYILSVAWPLVECHSHHRNGHGPHFVSHNLYRKQSQPYSG
jgi:hypothetical protein